MFDIHYHLLFGVDDGPKSIEASLELAQASIAEGVTHIVCTPHANDHWNFDPEVNRARLEMINERLGGNLTLGLGCDFHLSYENIEDLRQNPARYTINGTQYLLVEFSDFGIPPNIGSTFHEMQLSGLVPIITHPERNPVLLADRRRLGEWIESGCLVQVTAGSLDGRFGRQAESMSRELLRDGWVHFIASDAHSVTGRPPAMRRARQWLAKRYGEETADRLCLHNPRAAYFGQPLSPQPEAASPPSRI